MMHCGMEIVLPNGELIRTGMGALPDPTVDQDPSVPVHDRPWNSSSFVFNYGFGTYDDSIFTQSSLGVITKMGFWMLLNPGCFQAYMITLPRDEDLHAAVEIIRPLRIQMVLQNVPMIRHIVMAAAVHTPRIHYTNKKEPLNDEDLELIVKDLNRGRWNFNGALMVLNR